MDGVLLTDSFVAPSETRFKERVAFLQISAQYLGLIRVLDPTPTGRERLAAVPAAPTVGTARFRQQ